MSVNAILRVVVNLPDVDMERVFQGIARMPPIYSVALEWVSTILTEMFEESMDVIVK